MSKLRNFKIILIFSLITIASIVGFCIINNANKKKENIVAVEENISSSLDRDSDGYLLINNQSDLQDISLNGNYRLARDITIDISTWNPIGMTEESIKAFTGTFDGNGYTITMTGNREYNPAFFSAILYSFKINKTNVERPAPEDDKMYWSTSANKIYYSFGLFAYLYSSGDNAQVKNLELLLSDYSVYFQVESGIKYKVDYTNICIGGIAGYVSGRGIAIEQCKVNVDNVYIGASVSWTDGVEFGGVAGYVQGTGGGYGDDTDSVKVKIKDCSVFMANKEENICIDATVTPVDYLANDSEFFAGLMVGGSRGAIIDTAYVDFSNTTNQIYFKVLDAVKVRCDLYGADDGLNKSDNVKFVSSSVKYKYQFFDNSGNIVGDLVKQSTATASIGNFDSKVSKKWTSGGSSVWYQFSGINDGKPIQRAFLNIDTIRVKNDIGGMYKPSKDVVLGEVEVLRGYSTWKGIYDELGYKTSDYQGYTFVGFGLFLPNYAQDENKFGYIWKKGGSDVTYQGRPSVLYYTTYGVPFNYEASVDKDGAYVVYAGWREMSAKVEFYMPNATSGLYNTKINGSDDLVIQGAEALPLTRNNGVWGIREYTEAVQEKLRNDKSTQTAWYGKKIAYWEVKGSAKTNWDSGLCAEYDYFRYEGTNEISYGIKSNMTLTISWTRASNFYIWPTAESDTIQINAILEDSPLTVTTYNYNVDGSAGSVNAKKTIDKSVSIIYGLTTTSSNTDTTKLTFKFEGGSSTGYSLVGWSIYNAGYNRGKTLAVNNEGYTTLYNDVPSYYNIKAYVTVRNGGSRITRIDASESFGDVVLYPIVVKTSTAKYVNYLDPNKTSSWGSTTYYKTYANADGGLTQYTVGGNNTFPAVYIGGVRYSNFLIYCSGYSKNGITYKTLSGTDSGYVRVDGWLSYVVKSGSKIPSGCKNDIVILPLSTSEADSVNVNYYAPELVQNGGNAYTISAKYTGTVTGYEVGNTVIFDNTKVSRNYYQYNGMTSLSPNYAEAVSVSGVYSYTFTKVGEYDFYAAYMGWNDFNIKYYLNGEEIADSSTTFNIKNLFNNTAYLSKCMHPCLKVKWAGGNAPKFRIKIGNEVIIDEYQTVLDGGYATTPYSQNLMAISNAFVGKSEFKDISVEVLLGNEFDLLYYYRYDNTDTNVLLDLDINGLPTEYTANKQVMLPTMEDVKTAVEKKIGSEKASLYKYNGWIAGVDIYWDTVLLPKGTTISSLKGGAKSSSQILIYLSISPITVTVNSYGYRDLETGNLQNNYGTVKLKSMNNSSSVETSFDISNVFMNSYYYLGSLNSTYCDPNTPNAQFLGWKTYSSCFNKFANGLVVCNKSYTSGYAAEWKTNISFTDGMVIDLYGAWGYTVKLFDASGTEITSANGSYAQYIDVNKAWVVSGTTYYICTDTIPVKKGVWKAKSTSITTASGDYTALVVGNEYNGTSMGLQVSGDSTSKYFVGNIELQVVSTITFNLNGGKYNGSGDSVKQAFDYGQMIYMTSAPEATKEGYNLVGWEFDASAYLNAGKVAGSISGVSYSGTKYSLGEAVYVINYNGDYVNYILNVGFGVDVEVKAIWAEIVYKYTITYENDNGDAVTYKDNQGTVQTLGKTQEYYSNKTVYLYGSGVVYSDLNGNRFCGWYITTTLDSSHKGWEQDKYYDAGFTVTAGKFSGDITLRPLFVNKLILNANGGIIETDENIIGYYPGDNAQIGFDKDNYIISWHSSYENFDLPTFAQITKEGYVFCGWSSGTVGATTKTSKYINTNTLINWEMEENNGKYYVTTINSGSYGELKLNAIWEIYIPPRLVTLDANGNGAKFENYGNEWATSDTGLVQSIYKYYIDSSQLGTLPTPTRKGWTFKNWNTEADGSGKEQTSSSYVTENITLYAQWKQNYTITLNLNGGNLYDYSLGSETNLPYYDQATKTITYRSGDVFNLPGVAHCQKENCDFIGWKVTTSGGNWAYYSDIEAGATVKNKYGNVTLTAQWREWIKITLSLNGGIWNGNYTTGANVVVGDKEVYIYLKNITDNYYLPNCGNQLDVLTNADEKLGFVGWEITKLGTDAVGYREGDLVKTTYNLGNSTLQAQWEDARYSIKLHLNGGNEIDTSNYHPELVDKNVTFDAVSNKIKYVGVKSNIVLPTVTKQGYTFVSWKVTSTDGKPELDTEFKVENNVLSGYASNFELTAQWEEVIYSINFKNAGSYGEYNIVISSLEQVDSTLISNASTKTYPYISVGNKILYYTINSTFNLPYGRYAGIKFNGWKVVEADGSWVEDNTYSGGEKITSQFGNVGLAPIWETEQSVITFDFVKSNVNIPSDYTDLTLETGSGNTKTAKYELFSNANLPIPTVNGYKFTGWKATKLDDNANGWKMNEIYSSTKDKSGNVTLTAQWQIEQYKIYLQLGSEGNEKLNNYSLSVKPALPYIENNIIYYTIESTFNLPNNTQISKTGNRFVGWKVISVLDKNGGWSKNSILDGGASVNNKFGEVTIEAQWEIIEYTITLIVENDAVINGYNPSVDGEEYPIYKNKQIKYTYYTQDFYLPDADEVLRNGYELIGWEVTSVKYPYSDNWGIASLQPRSSVLYNSYGDVTLTAQWELKQYTLKLEFDGGSIQNFTSLNNSKVLPYYDSKNQTITYTIECQQFNLPDINNMFKNHYVFNTWQVGPVSLDSGIWKTGTLLAKDNAGAIYIPNGTYGSATLVAIWDEQTYTITFDTNGGEINGYSLQEKPNIPYYDSSTKTVTYTVQSEFSLPVPSNMVKNGYTFAGWDVVQVKDACGDNNKWNTNPLVSEQELKVAQGTCGNVTLKAKWEKITYTIQYAILDDDESVSNDTMINKIDERYTQQYTIEDKVTLLKDLSGYTITKWMNYGYFNLLKVDGNKYLVEDKNGGNWDSLAMVDVEYSNKYGNIVLYIQGSQTIYSIKLDTQEGVVADDYEVVLPMYYIKNSTTIFYPLNNAPFDLPQASQMSKEGYTFVGWVMDGVEYYESSSFVYENSTDGTKIPFTMTGSNGKYYIYGVGALSVGNVTLVAKWKANEYKITLNLDEGVLGEYSLEEKPNLPYYENLKITYNVENSISLPTKQHLTKTGFKLLGWSVEDGGENCKFSYTRVGDNNYITEINKGSYGNVTLKAQWQVVIYHIEYVVNAINGASFINWTKDSYTVKEMFSLPTASNVIANAYTFKNWKVENSVGNWVEGTEYSGGQKLSGMVGYINEEGEETKVKLIAQWTPIQFTISFDKGDNEDVVLNSNIKPISYTSDDVFTFPENDVYKNGVTRIGYNFAGWKVLSSVGNWQKDQVIWRVGNKGTELSAKYGDVTLIPIWSNTVDYTLTINLKTDDVVSETYYNNEQKNLVDVQYNITSTITIPTNEQVVANGYRLKGFKVAETSGNWNKDDLLELGSNLTGMFGDVTIDAVWEIVNYTLTLWLDGGNIDDAYELDGTGAVYDKYTKTITFNTQSSFMLPSTQNVTKNGNRLLGWVMVENGEPNSPYITDTDKRFTFGKVGEKYYILGLNQGNCEDLAMQAYWIKDLANISLDLNGGTLTNYVIKNEELDGEDEYLSFDPTTNIITYHSGAKFYLPTYETLTKKGFTFRGWMVRSDVNGKTEYDEIIDKYNTDSQRSSFRQVIFKLTKNAMDNNYYLTSVELNSVGGIELIAIWEENEYNLVFNYNNADATTQSRTLKYSELSQLDVIPTYENHLFMGWNAISYQTDRYMEISSNITEEYNENNPLNLTKLTDNGYVVWGAKILVSGSYIQSLTEGGDCRDLNKAVFTIYAVWLPEYEVRVEANGGQVFEDGVITSLNEFKAKNTFFEGYVLPTTLNTEMFNTPTTSGYRLFKKGFTIKNWTIKVNGKQYIVQSGFEDNPPAIYMWIMKDGQVDCGINLQYLQGDITATPNWEAIKFDVVFKTRGEESYKTSTKNTVLTTKDVLFGSKYFLYPETNMAVYGGEYLIQSTAISGYSIIYANPYNDVENGSEITKQIVNITISPSGIWNYENLTYRQHIIGDGSGRGTGWYVEIEGYYAPISYRVKLNLNMPYTTALTINEGDFVKTNANNSDLQARYQKLTLNSNHEYEQVAQYTEYQGKLFETDTEYYIYLLQDQEIKSKANENGLILPTFEIAYYEMQYYKLNNSVQDRYYVTTDDLKVEEPSAECMPKDWKYTYCDLNGETGGNKFEFNVIWYRNVINFEIKNILQNQNSSSGYVVVTEEEKLTDSLIGHNTTNVVIYTYDNDSLQYKYIRFAFDGELKQSISVLLNYSVEELTNLAITKIADNTLTIYSGNKITFNAYDQSKDSSMDSFIGYRFNQYSNLMKEGNVGSCAEIVELKNISQYTVEVDLSNYADSLEDKDTVVVNVEFANIVYKLRYIIGDANNVNAVDKYGKIGLTYSQMQMGAEGSVSFVQIQKDITDETIECFVDTNGIHPVESLIKVNLGYELNKWMFSNSIIGSVSWGNESLYTLNITPQFLRENLYTSIYSNEAEQNLGFVKAECKVIEFEINIHIVDISTNNELENYLLSDSVQPKVFTLFGENGEVTTVIINKNYTIKMIKLSDGKTQLYYSYNGKDYAYKEMYLASSLKYSTNQLITAFDYPTSALPDIALNVNYELLDKAVNYKQDEAVSQENRVLHFYVQVAPLTELTFEAEIDKYDIHKELRQIIVNGQVVLQGENEASLQVKSSYIGYLTQEVKITFSGNATYYSKAILTLPNGEVAEVATNGENGYIYKITEVGKIIVKLVPRTYLLDAQIEYNGTLYNAIDFKDVKNASNVNIFDTNKGVEIEASTNNAWYYNGDSVLIKYLLNSAVANDYTVQVLANNSGLFYNSTLKGYFVEFSGADIHIVIKIQPKTNVLTIITNMQNDDIGEVFVVVNNRTRYTIQNSGDSSLWKNQLTLEAGDTVRVLYKTNVGFKFDERYMDSYNNEYIAQSELNTVTKYYWFDMFGEDGVSGVYDSSKIGCYTLYFTHLSMNVEFKYFVRGFENNRAGEGYSFTSSTQKIEVGSEISIIKGKDNYGYRFINFTYKQPGVNQDAVELNEKFTIDGDILQYIATLPVTETSIKFIVYINYIDQYKVTFDLDDASKLLLDYSFKNDANNVLEEGVLYDRDTELTFDIYAKDKLHYYLISQFTVGTTTYEYSNSAENNLDECLAIATNNKNRLSGFSVKHTLLANINVKVRVYAEQFNVNLTEGYFETREQLDSNNPNKAGTINLRYSGNQFTTKPTIHYIVTGDFYYGTKVKIEVWVEMPDWDTEIYYTLDKVVIDGKEVVFNAEKGSSYNGKDCMKYTIEYELVGEELQNETEIEIDYKAIKAVKVKFFA